ncbi:MAG: DUF962 domain-containing protein [Endozoicomonas sp. (ex Botrylloides leachii)]|nr:DUF962 domain-containing protein [Endozoicomonas sp. (ex Botrylloides leachii)]
MKNLEQWFEDYGKSHRHHVNKLIHWFCVPMIVFSLLGLLWAIHWGLAIAVILSASSFYIFLSVPLALTALVVAAAMLLIISFIHIDLIPVSVTIFVIAWIFQFIGHHIEGKKPSFFKDLQFLLIGPLWVIACLFQRFRTD